MCNQVSEFEHALIGDNRTQKGKYEEVTKF